MVKSRKPRAPVRGTCIRTLVSAAAFAGILIGPVPLAGAAEAQLSVSPPEARPLHLVYDIYLGGFHTGRIELEIDIGHAREPAQAPARYRVVAETRSAGLIDYLIGFRSRAVSEGRQVGGTPHPTRHEVDNTWMGKPRSVRIRYADGAPSPHSRRDTPETVTIAPSPEVDERDPVPLDARVGAVDPLTAALRVTMIAAGPEGDGESLMRSTCVGAVPVFDGRRRYDIRLRDGAPDTVEGPYYHGAALRCRTSLDRIVGFSRNPFLPRSTDPEDGELWFAALDPALPPVPVRFKTDVGLGNALVHLVAHWRGDARPPELEASPGADRTTQVPGLAPSGR
jgi:hypothetical protein